MLENLLGKHDCLRVNNCLKWPPIVIRKCRKVYLGTVSMSHLFQNHLLRRCGSKLTDDIFVPTQLCSSADLFTQHLVNSPRCMGRRYCGHINQQSISDKDTPLL